MTLIFTIPLGLLTVGCFLLLRIVLRSAQAASGGERLWLYLVSGILMLAMGLFGLLTLSCGVLSFSNLKL